MGTRKTKATTIVDSEGMATIHLLNNNTRNTEDMEDTDTSLSTDTDTSRTITPMAAIGIARLVVSNTMNQR